MLKGGGCAPPILLHVEQFQLIEYPGAMQVFLSHHYDCNIYAISKIKPIILRNHMTRIHPGEQ
jgi:hypothetical protein